MQDLSQPLPPPPPPPAPHVPRLDPSSSSFLPSGRFLSLSPSCPLPSCPSLFYFPALMHVFINSLWSGQLGCANMLGHIKQPVLYPPLEADTVERVCLYSWCLRTTRRALLWCTCVQVRTTHGNHSGAIQVMLCMFWISLMSALHVAFPCCSILTFVQGSSCQAEAVHVCIYTTMMSSQLCVKDSASFQCCGG